MRCQALFGFLLIGCADPVTSNGSYLADSNYAVDGQTAADSALHGDVASSQADRTVQRCEPCQQNKQCVAGLFCEQGVCISSKDLWLDCPGACSIQPNCDVGGSCTVDPKKGCVIGSDADCQQSEHCATYGKCSMVMIGAEAHCFPETAAECAQSAKCLTEGWCGIIDNGGYGQCRATTEEHCKSSQVCYTQESCSLTAENTCK